MVILALGCADAAGPALETVATDDLLVLPLRASAPAVAASNIIVANDRESTLRLTHADQFVTLFAEIRFPRGSLESLGGTAVGATEEITVTAASDGTQYGLTVGPANLAFAAGARPTVEFSFVVHADFSVATSSGRYQSVDDYADALAIWEEVDPGRWQQAISSTTGTDRVTARLARTGRLLVAAPR